MSQPAILSVLIDRREPKWVQGLKFGGAPTTTTTLEHGDVLLAMNDGMLLAFERKTSDDLLNSLKDDRLFVQLVGLTGLTRWAYLVVCGMLTCNANGYVVTDRGETAWGWGALQGALLTAQEMGVFVLLAPDGLLGGFEGAVLRVAARHRDREAVIPPAKQPRILGPGEALLASLPGIGMEKASALLEYTGSPAWALTYLTEMDWDGERVPGIGRKTKEAIRNALGLEEWATLSVVTGDGHEETDSDRETTHIG